MLLTDYSSVGFDFSFLHKPVLYYQFDQQRFLGPHGLAPRPGRRAARPDPVHADEVLDRAGDARRRRFAMPDRYLRRADRFLTHRDTGSSERIFDGGPRPRAAPLAWPRGSPAPSCTRPAYRHLRRGRLYFPAMRAMVRLLQRLPADENRVVFESGVGPAVRGQPRYVYEELVRRGSQMTKVWAYTGKIHSARPAHPAWSSAFAGVLLAPGPGEVLGQQPEPPQLPEAPPGRRVPADLARHAAEAHAARPGDHPRPRRRVRGAGHRGGPAVERAASPAARTPPTAMRSAFHYDRRGASSTGYPRNDVFFGPDADDVAAPGAAPSSASARTPPWCSTRRPSATTSRPATTGSPSRCRSTSSASRASSGRTSCCCCACTCWSATACRCRPSWPTGCIDVSIYPEIQELYLASDVLVTDYSSVFFDYALLRRPIAFYAFDLEAYRDKLRGFYLPYYEATLPGPITQTQDELFDVLGGRRGRRRARPAGPGLRPHLRPERRRPRVGPGRRPAALRARTTRDALAPVPGQPSAPRSSPSVASRSSCSWIHTVWHESTCTPSTQASRPASAAASAAANRSS